jgi:hypothetical protein
VHAQTQITHLRSEFSDNLQFPHLTSRSENGGACLPAIITTLQYPPVATHCLSVEEEERNDPFENTKKKTERDLGRVSCLFVYAAWGINRRRKALGNGAFEKPRRARKLR